MKLHICWEEYNIDDIINNLLLRGNLEFFNRNEGMGIDMKYRKEGILKWIVIFLETLNIGIFYI